MAAMAGVTARPPIYSSCLCGLARKGDGFAEWSGVELSQWPRICNQDIDQTPTRPFVWFERHLLFDQAGLTAITAFTAVARPASCSAALVISSISARVSFCPVAASKIGRAH